MKIMNLKKAGWFFISFLVLLTIVADSGIARGFLRMIHALPMGDKVGHFMLTGILAFLVRAGFRDTRIRVGRSSIHAGVLLIFAIMTLEECSQMFIPHRYFSITDLLANYIGIATGSWFAVYVKSHPTMSAKIGGFSS